MIHFLFEILSKILILFAINFNTDLLKNKTSKLAMTIHGYYSNRLFCQQIHPNPKANQSP